jgi:hypothetical protein
VAQWLVAEGEAMTQMSGSRNDNNGDDNDDGNTYTWGARDDCGEEEERHVSLSLPLLLLRPPPLPSLFIISLPRRM